MTSNPLGSLRSFVSSCLVGLGAVAMVLSPEAAGQPRSGGADGVESRSAEARALEVSLSAWRAAHGAAWRGERGADGVALVQLAGGGLRLAGEVLDEVEAQRVARVALERTRHLFGVDSTTLELQHAVHLPLSAIGTSDKWAVRFRQRHEGIDAPGCFVNVLLDLDGRLLSVQSSALRGLERLAGEAQLSSAAALELARARFVADEGRQVSRIVAPRLAWTAPRAADGVVEQGAPRLAWIVELYDEAPELEPAGRHYALDARRGGLVWSAPGIHHFEVRGTVRALVTPGTLPDIAANPEVATPMRHLRVTAAGQTTNTDENGAFSFPGLASATSVQVEFRGPFNNVLNDAGAEYSLSQTVQPNTNAVLTMNPNSNAQATAAGNAFHHVNLLRDWVRSIIPGDATADFVMTANVNLPQTCNAYYNGSSTNYFNAGGSCVNTAYSSVVAHECGHWLNDRYGTGNGPDGIGEGNADVFAMYLYDTPLVGEDFCGSGCGIRTGLNTRQFCGDLFGGCHGQVHADGEVWMGAAWKVRDRLNQALGDSQGDLTADMLFLGWMNAYNQGTIRSVMETQWLVLDDDDANLADGTPHYAQIDGGFRAQGFPGVELQPLTIENLQLVADQPWPRGPYPIDARLVPQFGQQLVETKLFWRVNAGAWQSTDMRPQGLQRYSHHIPPVPDGAQVDWYVRVVDSLGNTKSSPELAPATSHAFRVGSLAPIGVPEGFENGPAGWTGGSYGDTANTAHDWERGVPSGKSGNVVQGTTPIAWRDPSAAASGDYCFGTDILPAGNGAYQANAHTWLRSPPLDFTGRFGVVLRCKRWLSVQLSSFDQARIRVNGQVCWTNPADAAISDSAWVAQEVDISDHADNRAGVVVEFELRTDGSVNLGGWAVDDIEFLALGGGAPPPPGAQAPISYGPGKLNTLGIAATLYGYGAASGTTGGFQVQLAGARANQSAILASSGSYGSAALFGGVRLIGSPFTRDALWTIDANGEAYHAPSFTPAMVGSSRYYQAFYRDIGNPDGTGVALSRALRIDIGP